MEITGKKTAYGVISLILFAVLCLATFPRKQGKGPEGGEYSVVFIGDSVYGNVRDETAIPAQVEKMIGKPVYNAALGGTSAGRLDTVRMDYSVDTLSLAALAKAIYADDFSVQHINHSEYGITFYFDEALDGLERIDFSRVETVVIGYGANDYFGGISLDNTKDPMDENTFAGALRSGLSYLRKRNPELKILLVTPCYSWLLSEGQTCEEFSINGLLEDYVELELRIAEEFDVDVLDLYHDFFPHDKWEDWEIYTFDGLHPNDAGRTAIAERIADRLRAE